MHIAPQHPPVLRSSSFGPAAVVHTSDCDNGNLTVTFPDGTQTVVPGIVGCCYDFWTGCNPCSDNSGYQAWANNYFPACSGPQGCVVNQSCS